MMDELPTQADKSQKLIELWFFRECNQGTRSHLYALFGYPVEQVRNHSTERIVLRKILAAHRIASNTEARRAVIEDCAKVADAQAVKLMAQLNGTRKRRCTH